MGQVASNTFFDTLRIECDAAGMCRKAVAAGMNLRLLDEKTVTVSLDETTEPADVEALLKVFGVASPDVASLAAKVRSRCSPPCRPCSSVLAAVAAPSADGRAEARAGR